MHMTFLALLLTLGGAAHALEPQFNVPYGPHERNVLDFYQAKSETPTPLVVNIHGGG